MQQISKVIDGEIVELSDHEVNDLCEKEERSEVDLIRPIKLHID